QQSQQETSHETLFCGTETRDAQSRRARDQNDCRICIEDRQSGQAYKHEWIPLPRGGKVSLKECDSRSGRATGDAWMSRQLEEHAARPGQIERKPNRCGSEQAKRNA